MFNRSFTKGKGRVEPTFQQFFFDNFWKSK